MNKDTPIIYKSLFTDPYGHIDITDRITVQCRISEEDYNYLKTLSLQRGLPQTSVALFIHAVLQRARAQKLSDYTDQKAYERIITDILGITKTKRQLQHERRTTPFVSDK